MSEDVQKTIDRMSAKYGGSLSVDARDMTMIDGVKVIGHHTVELVFGAPGWW